MGTVPYVPIYRETIPCFSRLFDMARRSRPVIPGLPHHVTQRGSRRGPVFFREEDREIYLRLLKQYTDEYSVQVLGYALMLNHTHLILVPEHESSLSEALKVAHMRYATVINGREGWTGHLWQQRFFSSPLDSDYFWTAMRYVERNPVAAGLVQHAADFKWSSAKAHTNGVEDPILSKDPVWQSVIRGRLDWYTWLTDSDSEERLNLLRDRTKKDLPCGSESFIDELEAKLGRVIMPGQRGRPKRQ